MNRLRLRLGFTRLELMVAVVVLLAIMVAVGRIFTTTSDVSASGQAIAETLPQGVAIEHERRLLVVDTADRSLASRRPHLNRPSCQPTPRPPPNQKMTID